MDEAPSPRGYGEQDPLREYINVLLKHWWLIALAAFLAALSAGVVSFSMTPTYEATAGVLIAKSKINVTLESQMQTLTESDMAMLRGYYWRDQEMRRATFTGLVKSGAVALQVIDELGDTWEEEERDPARLLEKVEGSVGQQGDLIKIVATADNAVKAADIANAWARAYADYVNEVYSGGLPESYGAVHDEAEQRKGEYEIAQKAVTEFIAEKDRTAELQRLIEEKTLIISELQSGKQAAIAAVIEEEIDIRRRIISAYLQAIADNRLLAFDKAQQAKRQVLEELIDAEIANRLAALRRDRDIRLQIFNSYVNAELQSTLAVFERQVDEKLEDLAQAYSRKDKLDRLLRDARSLRAQVAQDGSFESNQLALTLLKAEAFASSIGLPGELQVQLSTREGDYQLGDVEALIAALEQEQAQVEEEIEALSESLLAGEGYRYLDELSAANLSVSAPYTTPLSLLSSDTLSPTATVTGNLSAHIDRQYAELFDLGEMARSAEQVIGDTPLFQEFEKLYPDLFEPDALMDLVESISSTTPLREQAQQRAGELLQLDGMETILEFGVESEPLAQKIADLQREVRELLAEQETIAGQLKELKRERDLAWETYSTLARKTEELAIAIEAGGTEVQFASPAVVPTDPVSPKKLQNVALAGVVGLMLGVFVVMALHYLNPEYDTGALIPGRRAQGGSERAE